MSAAILLPVEHIRLEATLQPRNELNGDAIQQYAKDMADGADFPPVEVKQVGSLYYLVSGWHRVLAAKRANLTTILAIVSTGTLEDAAWEACGTNVEHDRSGLRRTNADKQKAVKMAIRAKTSNGNRLSHGDYMAIANHVGVSDKTVSRYAESLGVSSNGHAEKVIPNFDNVEIWDNKVIDPTPQPEPASYWDEAAERMKQRADEERKAQSEMTKIQEEIKTESTAKLNKTNDNIEWAAWSWNPVTGCLHDCPYCYARDIANRFYPEKFQPSFHPNRLDAPDNTNVPVAPRFAGDVGYKNIFTCSMADLFGKWVPTEWIDAVLQKTWDNPQWNFLFLTKFPIRMAEFDFPPNSWIGTTVDKQWSVDRAEKAFSKIRSKGYQGVAWLSCEPMMERLQFNSLNMFDWVVLGGSSRSTQTPEFRPPFEWIVNLWNQAKVIDVPVYMKTNLGIEQRVREYPTKLPS